MKLKIYVILSYILITFSIYAQSLDHPTIWITKSERNELIDKINNYEWAASIVKQLHSKVDEKKELYLNDPQLLIDEIPEFGDTKDMRKHNSMLTLAAESGMLYFITQDESYALLSANIVSHYLFKISLLTPEKTYIINYCFDDCRTCYNMLAIAYDFIYDYLNSGNLYVYSVTKNKKIHFRKEIAQKAFINIVGDIFREYDKPDEHGRIVSNHPVLTAPAALYSLLCVDDDKERERLFELFWDKGTWNQPSFKNTILPMLSRQGIWPESLSYSFMPNISMILNIIDRIKPEMNVCGQYMYIFQGNFLFDYLRYPDRRFVRFGDSKRNNDGTDANYSYALAIANRRHLDSLKETSQKALLFKYAADGGRFPKLSNSMYDNYYGYLQLFWGLPLPSIDVENTYYKRTVIIEHAGIALQRNYVENNNQLYGLCGIIGGAHYVHSHLTGLSMELYGAGYVMAPNAGMPIKVSDRWIPLHEHYRRVYAGNNTVVVNGTSHGLEQGSWKCKYWQNTAVNIAAEPEHLKEPVSPNFGFVTQQLDDKVNNCKQERTLGVIRTSATSGYYFDMFRSKSLDDNFFHDYIYHNIGDRMRITNIDGKLIDLKPTDRYKNDIGDMVHSPGWSFFEKTEVSGPTKNMVKVRFDIDFDSCYMHMIMPGGIEREYTKGLAPSTPEAKNGYLRKDTQVLLVRQNGEAWLRPYISILEPSVGIEETVKTVENITYKEKVIGAKVVSQLGERLITDYIICQSSDNDVYENNELLMKFYGRFGIIRLEKCCGEESVTLYIGKGKKISYGDIVLIGGDNGKGIKTVILD